MNFIHFSGIKVFIGPAEILCVDSGVRLVHRTRQQWHMGHQRRIQEGVFFHAAGSYHVLGIDLAHNDENTYSIT